MPEEDHDDKVEEEMLRMMQEEAGGEGEETPEAEATEEAPGKDAEDAGEDADLESQMLAAMLSETGDDDSLLPQVASPDVIGSAEEIPANVARLLDVSLSVTIELGRTDEPISTVLEWTEGSLIELSKVSGDAVDVLVNGQPYAMGEVVTIAENFGVRLTEILPRIRKQLD